MIIPGPMTEVVSVTLATKFAVATVVAFRVKVHGPVKTCGQTPPQLTKDEFALGASVRVMVVLLAKDVPVGDCVMVPGPLTTVVNEYLVTVVTAVPVTVASTAPAFVAKSRRAARLPRACGVNVMVIEQKAPAAMGALQLFVCEKSPGFEPMNVTPETVSGAVALSLFSS